MTTKKQSITTKLGALKLKPEWVKHRPGKAGMQLAYMSGEQYIQILNDIVGIDGYNWTVSEPEFIRNHDQQIIAVRVKGILEVHKLGVIREAWGTHDIRDDKDIADGIKAAETDALKRNCKYLNIGLQLYFSEPTMPKEHLGKKRPAMMTQKQKDRLCAQLESAMKSNNITKQDVDDFFGVVETTKGHIAEYFSTNKGTTPADLAFAVANHKREAVHA